MTYDPDVPSPASSTARTPSLFGRRLADDRPDLRVMTTVEAYWRSMIGKKQVPARRDIDPNQLNTALPYTMILERVAPGMARVRLNGQWINDLMGMDARGMPLSILVTPQSRSILAEKIETMFAGPAMVEVPLKLSRGWARKPAPGRLLMLPLTNADGLVTRAIAVVTTEGMRPGGGGTRFDVATDGAFRCTYMPKPHDMARSTAMSERRAHRGAPLPEPKSAVREWRVTAPLQIISGGKPALGCEPTAPLAQRPKLHIVVSNDF